jgi:hypothetical protein
MCSSSRLCLGGVAAEFYLASIEDPISIRVRARRARAEYQLSAIREAVSVTVDTSNVCPEDRLLIGVEAVSVEILGEVLTVERIGPLTELYPIETTVAIRIMERGIGSDLPLVTIWSSIHVIVDPREASEQLRRGWWRG